MIAALSPGSNRGEMLCSSAAFLSSRRTPASRAGLSSCLLVTCRSWRCTCPAPESASASRARLTGRSQGAVTVLASRWPASRGGGAPPARGGGRPPSPGRRGEDGALGGRRLGGDRRGLGEEAWGEGERRAGGRGAVI